MSTIPKSLTREIVGHVHRAWGAAYEAEMSSLRAANDNRDESHDAMRSWMTRVLVRALRSGSDRERRLADAAPSIPRLWERHPESGMTTAMHLWFVARGWTPSNADAAINDPEERAPLFFGGIHKSIHDMIDQLGPAGATEHGEPVTDAVLASEGRPLLKSALAVRLWFHLACRVYAQRQSGENDWRRVVFASWSDVARAIGAHAGRDGYNLRRIAHAFDAMRVELPKPRGTGRIFVLADGSPVAFTAVDGMLTGTIYTTAVEAWSHENRGLEEAKGNRRLVPYPERLPPMVGRPNEHAALMRLGFAVCLHLATSQSSREIYANRGAVITERDWRTMAKRTGVPTGTLEDARERWTRDANDEERARGDDAPAFLRRIGDNRYMHAHETTHALLRHGGQTSQNRADQAAARHDENRGRKRKRRR